MTAYPNLVFDTNRLCTVTPRRFFGSLQESKNARLTLLPRIQTEMLKAIPAIETANFYKPYKLHQQLYNSHDPKKIATAAGEIRDKCQQWLENEFTNSSSIFKVLKHDKEHKETAILIESMIPETCFKKYDIYDVINDKTIIAEALVHGVHIIATNNINTINYDNLNDWVINTFPERTEPFILSGDEATRTIAPGPEGSLWLAKGMLGALLPNDPTKDFSKSIEHFKQNLNNADLPETVMRIDEAIHTHNNPNQLIDHVYSSLPTKARNTEERLRTEIKKTKQDYELEI